MHKFNSDAVYGSKSFKEGESYNLSPEEKATFEKLNVNGSPLQEGQKPMIVEETKPVEPKK